MVKQGVLTVLLVGCKLQSGSTFGGSSNNSSMSSSTPASASSSSSSAAPERAGGGGGSQPMTMPDIQLMTPDQAQVALQKAGYERTPSVEEYACSDTTDDGRIVEPGRICFQKPAPGQSTGSKLPVAIRVQDKNPYEGEKHKEKWVFMPDVKGKTVEQARAAMKAEGITVEPILVAKAGCAANTVCDTLPAAEARTAPASEKLLFVGK